jgi:hypothetical protein
MADDYALATIERAVTAHTANALAQLLCWQQHGQQGAFAGDQHDLSMTKPA